MNRFAIKLRKNRRCPKSQRMSFLRMSLDPASAGQESYEYLIINCSQSDIPGFPSF